MKSHICSSSTQLWKIIRVGFNPNNLTPREEVDEQLNTTALHIIQQSLTKEYMAHIRKYDTAKQAWDHLTHLFIGNESIQSSKFDELNSESEGFHMFEGEDPKEMYRRLTTLSVAMTDRGCKDTNDKWIRCKFIDRKSVV